MADVITEIEKRNHLRRECGLPQLSVNAESQRLKAAEQAAKFEVFYERERPKYNHLWNRLDLGWLGGHVIWTKVRQQILANFGAKKTSRKA